MRCDQRGVQVDHDLADGLAASPRARQPKGKNRKKTTVVGSFPANPWGLYDLYGNVWEWCADEYAVYTGDDQTDPCANDKQLNEYRVLRGGSWFNHPLCCRAANRDGTAPADRVRVCGFRVCFRLD